MASSVKEASKSTILKLLFVWGYAGTGALGESKFLKPLGDRARTFHQRRPWRSTWSDKYKADLTHVACGNGFSLISVAGTRFERGHQLFGTGINTESQLGVHETSKGDAFKYIIQPAPIDLMLDKKLLDQAPLKILDLACGRAHSVVLTNHGVITFGANSYGQCGRPIVENEEYYGNRAVIQNITSSFDFQDGQVHDIEQRRVQRDRIVAVKAGQDHTCFLSLHGKVFTCGWSSDGQLGQNIYTLNWKPTQLAGDLKDENIVQIATKGDFVLALSKSGDIFGWGNNEYSQLRMSGVDEPQVGSPLVLRLPSCVKKPVQQIAASGTHCMLLDNENQVWVWGYGLLGRGPACIETTQPLVIPETLFGRYKEIEHSMSKRIVNIECGLNSSAVVLDDGSLYMWGKNRYGNLGLGEKFDCHFPLRVSLPAKCEHVACGPDQTFTICKSYL